MAAKKECAEPSRPRIVTITPVFIFSAPRSGSTMLQRVLAAHNGVATVSEPWILLPFLQPLRAHVSGTGSLDPIIQSAVSDFVQELPNGRADYLASAREAGLAMYRAAAGPAARWFVDKTPSYHLIVDEIAEAFPEAPLIFLWRNPLGVVASSIALWDRGRFQAPRYNMALFQSFEDMTEAFRRHKDRSHAVRFEDLVTGDRRVWGELIAYVGLEFEPQALERFAEVDLHGRLGDPPTAGRNVLDRGRAQAWRESLDSPLRRAWCRRYLHWLGQERLALMGYDLKQLVDELNAGSGMNPLRLVEDALALGSSAARDIAKRIVPPHYGGRSSWRDLAMSDRDPKSIPD
jgi:hypothetical protein